MSEQGTPVYRFSGCELDPRERRLRVNGEVVALTPKVFDTLVLLVERAGHALSKDELMSALWPRGFVHESNLTKHIWLLRRALGDGDGESRFIETIPKLGYRFTAQVKAPLQGTKATSDDARAAALPSTTEISEWGEGRHTDRRASAVVSTDAMPARALRPAGAWVLAALVVSISCGVWFVHRPRPHFDPVRVADADAVAIVDFGNLSANPKDAWLGPALQQMLATEIAAEGRFHAVSEELVRPARADLPPPDAGGYAPASLRQLQQRLGAHYVLSGAYLVSGNALPQLRIDVTVQDAATGKPLANLSRSAAVADLPQLVSRLGADLRSRFGLRVADARLLRQTANAQPPTAEVARHVGFALDALQRSDPARARDELLLAIAQAPAYAPAYATLARAYAAMGYREKATAAISMAQSYAQALAPEQRLSIDLQAAQLANDTHRALGIVRESLKLHPDSLDLQMSLASMLAENGQQADAEQALSMLRRLPAATGDPRVELLADRVAAKKGDTKAALAHAQLALRLARDRGQAGQVAAAQLDVGSYSEPAAAAESSLRAAAAGFRAIGNPHGEALAYQDLGNLYSSRNQIDAAREAYQRAMSMYQAISDVGGQAAVYDNLGTMLWNAGEREGTAAAVRESLRIAREINDKVRQAWCLAALAQVMADDSAGDDAVSMLREAIALDRETGERRHLLFALSAYTDLLRTRGELADAARACEQARQAAQAALDPSQKTGSDFACAQVALDRGGVKPAEQAFTTILHIAQRAGDAFNQANAQMMLGQIALGRQHWRDAASWFEQALRGWRASDQAPGQAVAGAMLALADAHAGDRDAAKAALATAKAQRIKSNQKFEVLPYDIIAAQLQGEAGDADAAGALRTIADDASSRHWAGMAFEARLALLDMQAHRNDPGARATRDALAADARRNGFGWVLQRIPPLVVARRR